MIPHRLRIKLVSLEDGITSCGFRKIAAFTSQINPDTESLYVTTKRYLGLRNTLFGSYGVGELGEVEIDEIAHWLIDADLIGFSSMTGYAEITRRVVRRVRELRPEVFMIWGGIHPIIHPEDAITADVDAICTGEGEFALQQLLDALEDGRDHTEVDNFWFKRDGEVVRNRFLPLMTADAMETLPFPQFGERERIYKEREGFVPTGRGDYLANDGLTYTTLWSIGCPFHCTYCGNTKFIANDPKYKRIRHPSARYIVEEVKAARRRFPHISHVSFHDDSFMAIPYDQLAEFAELWHDELSIPFAVYGVIPNYVKREKFEILTWAGMNRVRMGIQSGSEEILEFYKRPTPPAKIRAAAEVIGSFSPEYHIPPSYDIIMDNPVETRSDVVDTLELLYELPRPYTLFIYSLKVIPNTQLEQAMRERGIDLEQIDSSYASIPPRWANLLLYLLTLWRPPRWLFDLLLRRVRASGDQQRLYPRLGLMLRAAYLGRKVINHLRYMDFSLIPGSSGYVAWRLGLVRLWQRRIRRRLPRPAPPERRARTSPKPRPAPLTVDLVQLGESLQPLGD
jgi:anaerobic magnesium-protoporphyrin IX monomethyl ester cyclase